MSIGLASDIVIKLFQTEQSYTLSFQRSFDRATYEIPLLRWQERISHIRRDLPSLLDPLRRFIGFDEMELDEGEVKRATAHLNRLGFGMLALLLEGTGRAASDTMYELTKFLAPVFLTKPPTARPVVEIEAASADDLVWRMPFEFLPIAPPLDPLLTPREDFERFLGFRTEIARLLRAGPTNIERQQRTRSGSSVHP